MKKLLPILFGVLVITGCYNDKEDQLYPSVTTCDTSSVNFTVDVLPVMRQKCATAGCHDAVKKESGYDLGGYPGVKLSIDDGKLLGVIRHESGFSAMPKGMAKLDDCTIRKITRWVNLGAMNN